ESLSRVVLLAHLGSSVSLWAGARSTGRLRDASEMRVTEPRLNTVGLVTSMTRLMTAIVLENGSLTNSCRTTGGCVYGFMITPKRGSTVSLGGSKPPATIEGTVRAGVSPSRPFAVWSVTLL